MWVSLRAMIKKKAPFRSTDATEWRSLLREGAAIINVSLTDEQIDCFGLYLRELQEWNEHINLTAIKSLKDIIVKHFLDSLTVLEYLPCAGRLADLGSGGGFPGIPIKVVRPSFEVTLVESVRKKVSFLRHVIRVLNLQGIEVYHGRAEALPSTGGFDCIVSRAFADLGKFFTIGAPLVKNGGTLVAMKGKNIDAETKKAELAAIKNSLLLVQMKNFSLPFHGGVRSILVFQKNVSRETII